MASSAGQQEAVDRVAAAAAIETVADDERQPPEHYDPVDGLHGRQIFLAASEDENTAKLASLHARHRHCPATI